MEDEKNKISNFGNLIIVLVAVTFIAVIFMAGIYAQQQYETEKRIDNAIEATKKALSK